MPRERVRVDMVYKFEELSEKAQDNVLERLSDINVDYGWWESTFEDAKNIGLKLTEFELNRGSYCKGEFTQSAKDVAKAIIKEHGKDCETHKTAQAHLKAGGELEDEALKNDVPLDEIDTDEIDAEFLKSLLEDYRIILQHEYEYMPSKEAILETISANEYEFTEDGRIA